MERFVNREMEMDTLYNEYNRNLLLQNVMMFNLHAIFSKCNYKQSKGQNLPFGRITQSQNSKTWVSINSDTHSFFLFFVLNVVMCKKVRTKREENTKEIRKVIEFFVSLWHTNIGVGDHNDFERFTSIQGAQSGCVCSVSGYVYKKLSELREQS